MGLVVVVSGLPAAGKTTLSARLAADLGAVHVRRDHLRNAVLQDIHEHLDATGRAALPAVVDRLVGAVAGAVLRGGGTVVLDNNFNTPEHAQGARSLVAEHQALALEVCLWGDADALRARFVERADPPLTADLAPYFERVVTRERWTVLGPEQVVAHIDATDLGAVERAYPAVLTAIRAASG